jgi:membrane protease YdiL (CAAX protease family)
MIFNEKVEGFRKYFGIVYACYTSFGFIMLIALLRMIFGDAIDYSKINPITNIILPLIVVIIYIPIILKPLRRQKIKNIVIWTLIAIVLKFVARIVFRFFENNLIVFLGYDLNNFNTESLGDQLNTSNILLKIFGILSMCLIGPFVEEVIYRVCLFTTLRRKIGISAHLITALLFGFQHIAIAVLILGQTQEFLYMFSYMGGSLISSIMYEKTKTPVPGIISHMIGNSINLM